MKSDPERSQEGADGSVWIARGTKEKSCGTAVAGNEVNMEVCFEREES